MDATGDRTVVIGIGNPDRGDDSLGRTVVRALHGKVPPGVELLEHNGEATGLLAALEGAAAAFIVDACASGAPPGTVYRFDAAAGPLPRHGSNMSTHGFGPGEAVELGRALGQLPGRCIIYAIEGEAFTAGAPLSQPVRAATDDLVDRIRRELAADPEP